MISPLTTTSVLYTFNDEEIILGNILGDQFHYYKNNVCVTLQQAIDIACNDNLQRSDYWKQERRKRITTCEAYSLFTCANNRHTDANWLDKVKTYVEDSFRGNKATAWGLKTEPESRKCYEEKTKSTVLETGLMVNPSIPWLGYSPDGILPKKNKIIEIKCPVAGRTKPIKAFLQTLKFLEISGENIGLKQNHKYYCQIQLGMFVTNTRACDFIIYSSFAKMFHVIHVPYNETLVKNAYIPTLQYVYFSRVLKYLVSCDSVSQPEAD